VNSWINLTALWKIVVIGLLAGAGLPALFALGLRALSPRTQAAGAAAGAGAGTAPIGDGGEGIGSSGSGTSAAGDGQTVSSGPLGIAVAGLCFLVVLAAIGWGIYSIVHNS
jgi:hypothetical protein